MGVYHLQTLFPRTRSLPLSRDRLMLLIAAVSELFTGIDVYLAHNVSGSITRYEWIPIIFGVVAGIVLLLAGLLALANRALATVLANLVFIGSIIVGFAGVYFHLVRGGLVGSTVAQGQELSALIWAPPFLGPFFFVLIGVLGISAAWVEDPPDSGRLHLLGKTYIQMPYSKTRAYFLIVGIFALVTTITSVLDHSRANFTNVAVWLPMTVGLFATVTALVMGFITQPTRTDLATYVVAILLLMFTGLIGLVLHINSNLVAQGSIVVERFIRGSPLLAPLLFVNTGLLGIVVLLDPNEEN
ncbi:MAG: hypothetical protein K8L99_30040 [Anaerolineae bacterium]|nr:hypothetical protein [Anaerolineae bacterium]